MQLWPLPSDSVAAFTDPLDILLAEPDDDDADVLEANVVMEECAAEDFIVTQSELEGTKRVSKKIKERTLVRRGGVAERRGGLIYCSSEKIGRLTYMILFASRYPTPAHQWQAACMR